MFGCDGISDYASWNEVFHYRDTKLSWYNEKVSYAPDNQIALHPYANAFCHHA